MANWKFQVQQIKSQLMKTIEKKIQTSLKTIKVTNYDDDGAMMK